MWLVNFRNLLIRVLGLIILWSGCGALRVAIPKEAQVFRDKIMSDALSYSYSALEFGASNETQFKTWSLVKNLSSSPGSGGGHVNKSQFEYGIEDNRWPAKPSSSSSSSSLQRKAKQQLQQNPWPNHHLHHQQQHQHQHSANSQRPTKKTASPSPFKPSPVAVSPFPVFSLRSSINPMLVSDIYPNFGFHPLLFSTSPTTPAKHHHQKKPLINPGSVFNHFEFRSSTPRTPFSDTPSRIVLSSGISVASNEGAKKPGFKQLGRLKKGKARSNRFRKGKLRPVVGLDHFNVAVQQALHVSAAPTSTTQNPFPNLSPGYSRVTQNLPNSVLPAVVYGTTTNHLDDDDGGPGDGSDHGNGNNSWIPILGPNVRASGGGGSKGKKVNNLTRILKNKSRPRHRYSSNYSSNRGQSLKVRSHRLAGILSQNQSDVVAVYPHNKNYSTVTARSRALSSKGTTTTMKTTTSQATPLDKETMWTTTPNTAMPTTTTESSQVIHARITKIPNRRPVDVVLNVTTQFPVELDEKVRARLKAIRKIVRRLP